MGIFSKNLIEEEFDLKRAILNNEVNIIFGDSEEFLEEIVHLRGTNRMEIIVRNHKEDVHNNFEHWFSMKFIPARNIKFDSYDGRKGIPIVFEILFRQTKDGIEYYPSDWNVFFGGNKQHKALANQVMKELNNREKQFINSVVEQYGLIILEYWELDPDDSDQYKRIREIEKYIESQLVK